MDNEAIDAAKAPAETLAKLSMDAERNPIPTEQERPRFVVLDDGYQAPDGNHYRAGVWHFGNRPGKGDNPPTPEQRWICSPLHVEAVTYDNAGANFGRLLRFRNTLGKWGLWAMADRLDLYATGDEHQRDVEDSSDELRRQHAEIQQLKAREHELEQMHDHSNLVVDAAKEHIASLEAQLSARQAAPDGWRLVPESPTEEMVTAGQESFGVHDCYYAMLSAAPPPPEQSNSAEFDGIKTPPPEREPLSIKKINELEAESGLDHYELVRLVERAHGIGATND